MACGVGEGLNNELSIDGLLKVGYSIPSTPVFMRDPVREGLVPDGITRGQDRGGGFVIRGVTGRGSGIYIEE